MKRKKKMSKMSLSKAQKNMNDKNIKLKGGCNCAIF